MKVPAWARPSFCDRIHRSTNRSEGFAAPLPLPTPYVMRPLVAVSATSRIIDGALRIRLNASYVHALERAGLVPLVIPPLEEAAASASVLDVVDGLVLTGGEDVDPTRFGRAPHPTTGPVHDARDATEIALLLAARERRLPTLAICRGIQLANVALGGTLIQDIPSELGQDVEHDTGDDRKRRAHRIILEGDSRLQRVVGAPSIDVNSMHHQALDVVAGGLIVTARASDGTIEAVEAQDPDWWCVGVQWHPEELVDTEEPWDRALFAAFARACGDGLSSRSAPPRPEPAASGARPYGDSGTTFDR
jgi:putative glutamine amidotransferase